MPEVHQHEAARHAMALHPDLQRSPYEIISAVLRLRWFPAAEELRSTAYEKLLPPLVAEVERESPEKNIDALDITVPRLTRRYNRELKDLTELEPEHFGNPMLPVKSFTPAETREIVFKTMLGEVNADSLELAFAAFLEDAPDVVAFGKRYMAVGFKIEYVTANGELSTYTPDFLVRTTDGKVWIVETKGREEIDLPQKMARLCQWCEDADSSTLA